MALFRDEAMEAKRAGQQGALLVVTRPPVRWITIAGVAFLASIAAVLLLTDYTRRERVVGELSPRDKVQNAQSRISGVVTDVHAQEGQVVKRGHVIARISLDVDGENGLGAYAEIRQKLQQQHARLASEIGDKLALQRQVMHSMQQQAQNISARNAAFNREIQLQQGLIESASARLERFRPLVKEGYISGMQMEQQEASVIQAKASLSSLQREHLQSSQELAKANDELHQYPQRSRSERSESERALIGIEQELAKNEVQREVVIRATQDGVVTNMLITQGMSVSVGQPLFQVIHPQSPLQARLLVESRAVGMLKAGQRVVMRYPAFPYQQFGQRWGTIESVSSSGLRVAESATFTDASSKRDQLTPLYQVLVALDEQSVEAHGTDLPLRSGMQVEADLVIERQKLISWLLAPLTGMQKRMASGARTP